MNNFQDLINRGQAKHGEKFSIVSLDTRFIKAYENQNRIKVSFGKDKDMTKTGTVGATTGWQPVFILMLTKRSLGSSWILDKHATIIKG